MMDKEIFEITYSEEVFQIKLKPVVVINEPWEKLGEKERELLSKIISALKISIDSITIVTHRVLDIPTFKGKAASILYFGHLPKGVACYEVLEADGISFICSENLTALLVNEPARKQLWVALKKLFSV